MMRERDISDHHTHWQLIVQLSHATRTHWQLIVTLSQATHSGSKLVDIASDEGLTPLLVVTRDINAFIRCECVPNLLSNRAFHKSLSSNEVTFRLVVGGRGNPIDPMLTKS